MLGLPKILFRTFILSTIIGIAVTCIWYAFSHQDGSGDYAHALPKIIIGALFLNFLLVGMSLPVLFLANPAIRQNTVMKLILYFAGPIVLMITVLVTKSSHNTRIFYLMLAAAYTIIHAFYYFRTVNKVE
jgi:hypothetical protein